MRIVTFWARQEPSCYEMQVVTVRHYHPDAELIHMTDMDTPQLKGTDAVWRHQCGKGLPGIIVCFTEHVASMSPEPTIILDADILVAAPLYKAFNHKFDVAFTLRHGPRNEREPYNTGVVFCRNPAFYAANRQRMEATPRFKEWSGVQECTAREAESGKWRILELPGNTWNYSPAEHHTTTDARVLHYKGARKKFMRKHFEAGIWKSSAS